ncbi:Dps family protein [Pontibacter anaerobius]|uniref:DNA starvation/stationary phase protection protein n=1 Tax=Pontibacter anaerobius TaxID=2993940 RepID=A0ABT3RDJ2_9BACT|nr:Dps family protein [Pontibacter anaerobius]MCX2739913.1 DNA starvation/stationary phase protection protein [Pontibacter anaerobius]
MATKNMIGIDVEKAAHLADKLNTLLADYQLFYINARGFHWNISGNKFFELHAKFEELYSDAVIKIDEIAERILTLGHTPFHSFTAYLENATIKEVADVSDGDQAVREVLNGFKVLIEAERELLALSAEADDEGTNALMSDYIREQEKLVWMYSAYLRE